METLFSRVLNMSLTGSLVILAVLLVRVFLKRFPKIFSYALWAVVLFRLLCPVSLSAPVSAMNWLAPEVEETSAMTSRLMYVPVQSTPAPVSQASLPEMEEPETISPVAEKEWDLTILDVAMYLWALGAAGMLLRGFFQYLALRRRLAEAIELKENVFLSDQIETPFVLGIVRPRIYLPCQVLREERRYILAHERHHIRRGDHLIKLVAYFALCLHWFNPLVWVAFVQAGKDMEMSCDEAVIRQLGPRIRAEYASALLRLSTKRRNIAGSPLAFGEGDTKGRIINMANWKKPRLWASLICLIACVGVLVACGVNPAPEETASMEVTTETTAPTTTAQADALEVPYEIGELPEGCAYETKENGEVVFTAGGTIIGGITLYPISQEIDLSTDTGMEQVGIPDYTDPGLWKMGGGSGNGYAWELEVGTDAPEGTPVTVHRRHYFAVTEDCVYDVWFDLLATSDATHQKCLKAIRFPSLMGPEDDTQEKSEQAVLDACRAMLESFQSGSYYVRREGEKIGVVDQTWSFLYNEGDRLQIVAVDFEDHIERHAILQADGAEFRAIPGTWSQEEIQWQVKKDDASFIMPWLASFVWNPDTVAYMGQVEGCYLLRVDEPYPNRSGTSDYYFVNFYFDESGTFTGVNITVDLFMETEQNYKETIVTTDPTVIAAEIDREYQRALELTAQN